jgi:hypothetical protein
MRRIFLYHSLLLKTTILSIPLGHFLSLACLWAVTGPFIIPARAQTADECKTLQNTASVSRSYTVLLCGLVRVGWVGISWSSCYDSVVSAAENDTNYEKNIHICMCVYMHARVYVCFI